MGLRDIPHFEAISAGAYRQARQDAYLINRKPEIAASLDKRQPLQAGIIINALPICFLPLVGAAFASFEFEYDRRRVQGWGEPPDAGKAE
jgi:hypothetical protein